MVFSFNVLNTQFYIMLLSPLITSFLLFYSAVFIPQSKLQLTQVLKQIETVLSFCALVIYF